MIGSEKYSVDILLSTYNGEKYIEELIDSILSQDYSALRILVRDDGSSDNTCNILRRYCDSNNQRFFFIEAGDNVGSTDSFYKLCSVSTADFIMFADQDDIWLRNKVSTCLNAYHLDRGLVYCDLKVVDEKLNIIQTSMLNAQKLQKYKGNVEPIKLLCQSTIAGCTMFFDREMLMYALGFGEFPDGIVHDHWLAIILATRYQLICVDEPLLLYRQHQGNQIGAIEIGLLYFLRKITLGIFFTLKYDFFLINKLKSCKVLNIKIKDYLFVKFKMNIGRLK